MDAKEILDPQKLIIAVGAMVVIMSLMGMTSGEEWAAVGWGGEENVLAHDAAYEEMWALHLMPLGCLLYTSPSSRDQRGSRMPSSA